MTAKLTNAQIAWRAAQDIPDGAYVNLGIGFPEMVARFKPEGREVIYHTENGILGFGEAPAAGQEDWDLINAGKIELELVPQGTLAERIRAAGAGIPAFYTPTSYGTQLAEGKPVAEFEGRHYVQERWLKADVALIKAEIADRKGNLTYSKAARNFAPLMAMAAAKTIVQARRIVEPGGIDPEHVVTPGIFVDCIVEVAGPKQEEVLLREGAKQ
jgi:acyl CoA:acetate/3-ketoacid CoA transferase alpha subunit